MKTLTFANEYEKAIASLALRQYIQSELTNALNEYKKGNLDAGKTSQERAETATKLADSLK